MRRLIVPALLSAVAFGTGSPAATAATAEGPWCAHIMLDDTMVEKCDIWSLEACRREYSGNGGYCTQNPYFRGAAVQDSGRRRARPRQR